jgi:hypothetical protein
MAISTYAELQSSVADWLDRSDLTARIPDFISLAEARFDRVIRTPDMVTRDDSFTVDSQYETLPTGFLGVERFLLDASPLVALEYMSPARLSARRERRTVTGVPGYYTIAGGNFEFFPSPNQAYTSSLLYYARLAPLSDSATSNWLLAGEPDVYLFGALVEASPYLKDPETTALWEARLQRALSELAQDGERKAVGQTPSMRFQAIG